MFSKFKPLFLIFSDFLSSKTTLTILSYPFDFNSEKIIQNILLKQSGCIVYPTETFYALGCASTDRQAVLNIYRLKKRQTDQPLLVLVNGWEMLNRYVENILPDHLNILNTHWPGPLTAILKYKEGLSPELNTRGPCVGFRMTSSPIAKSLIDLIGVPIVGTSANLTSEQEAVHCNEAIETFGDSVELYIDGGKTPGKEPSTLVDMTTKKVSIVRKGAISL